MHAQDFTVKLNIIEKHRMNGTSIQGYLYKLQLK